MTVTGNYEWKSINTKAGILATFKRQYNTNTKINISMKKSILLKNRYFLIMSVSNLVFRVIGSSILSVMETRDTRH